MTQRSCPLPSSTLGQAQPPVNPRKAASCCASIDDLLDPQLFAALCEPTRARLLACLIKCRRACSVGELAACCNVDLSVVSRHLATLARIGAITATRKGRTVLYSPRLDVLSSRFSALAAAILEYTPVPEQCCDAPLSAKPKRVNLKSKGAKPRRSASEAAVAK